MENLKEAQMRKRNMKLFPLYKTISWDYLFFYTINFLFLTQIKNIDPADVLLIDSFYYLFGIIVQMPATFIVEFLGRKNSLILANILNAIYMILIIFSSNLYNLIIAEITSALAFGIKEVAEPSLLNESIPQNKSKSKIFAKLNEKGTSRYYILNAVSTLLAGMLYQINGYLPIIISCLIIICATILSCKFVEPVKNHRLKIENKSIIKELHKGFKFVLTSERLKALLLYSAIMSSLYCIMQIYEINLLEELNVSSSYIGVLFAILRIISGISSENQEKIHKRYRNRSLQMIAVSTISGILVTGVVAVATDNIHVIMVFIVIQYVIKYICSGLYYNLIEKYLRNFANEKIDTKIFAVNRLLKSIMCAISGVGAAYLLNRLETAYCILIIGIIFAILIYLTCKYMNTRVGLKADQYSNNERKYDELKI